MNERLETRSCASCGRTFEWRFKWMDDWSKVRYCSKRCRTRRIRPIDRKLESSIHRLLSHQSGTICPSEAAREVSPEAWRQLMNAARSAGRRLAHRGEILVKQQGRIVDPSAVRGAIRYARGPHFSNTRHR